MSPRVGEEIMEQEVMGWFALGGLAKHISKNVKLEFVEFFGCS